MDIKLTAPGSPSELPLAASSTFPFMFGSANRLCIAILGSFVICQSAQAQSILPPAPGAIGGGNPLQGLGRPDDPSPSRYQDFAQNNLQIAPTSNGSGAFSSDLLNKSTLDNQNSNATEGLDKLLSPDGLKSLTGSESEAGSGSDAASGLESGQKSNSIEFTDRAGAAFSEQLQGSNVGDSPSGDAETSDRSSGLESSQASPRENLYGSEKPTGGPNSSLSTSIGSDAGNEGLPPEPPGLATPLSVPSLSNPLKTTSLSSAAEKAENTKTDNKSGESKKPADSERASTRGASEKHQSATFATPSSNRKASPLSVSVSDRIRHELESRARARQTLKTEPAPLTPQLVPAPPPMAVSMTPEGPTPERQALSLMKQGSYDRAERQLRDLISTDPTNLHARYLFAVTLVFNKKYDEAKTNYGLIIRKAQDKRLVEMAETGLHKLMH